MPAGTAHHVEDALNEFLRDVLMEQVTHRINKDPPRCTPTKGVFEHMFMGSNYKTVDVVTLAHPLESFRHSLCVAVSAAWANLVAASDGIPRGFSPFNR